MVHIEQFKNYYLTRRIGIGGMAEIFRAWRIGEHGFEKQVVIKRLLSHFCANDDFRNMFLDEARLASQLNHPNIVDVYDLGKHAVPYSETPNYFLAMEYIFGKNLAEIRNKAKQEKLFFSLEYIVRIITGAALALHYAHEKKDNFGQPLNIVHRDVTPQNILISYDGDIKLVDFGIAKALSKSVHTQAGILKGKLAYMSPEQARGESIDRRADIYALGVVFWELLTGERLFTDNSEAAILQKVLNPEIKTPSSIATGISPELDTFCMKCLAKQPEDRYPDAKSLAIDLETFMSDLTTFPGSYSIRGYMHVLFDKEIEDESLQIQEELKAVRTFMETGSCQDATLVMEDGSIAGKNVLSDGAKLSATRKLTEQVRYLSCIFMQYAHSGMHKIFKSFKKLAGIIPKKAYPAAGATVAVILLVLFLFSNSEEKIPIDEIEKTAETPVETVSTETLPLEPLSREDIIDLTRVKKLLEKKDFDGALSLLLKAEEGEAWSHPELKNIRAKIVTNRAVQIMDTNPDKAYNDLLEAASHVPDYSKTHLQKGRALSRLGQYSDAIKAYNKAIELDQSLHVAHFNSGIIYLQEHEYNKAEQAFLNALELEPPYLADVLVNLAGVSIRSGDIDKAVDYLRKAVQTDPDHEIARQNLERLTQ